MRVAVALQVAALVGLVVGVYMLAGAGWAVLAGSGGCGLAGWVLEQGQHSKGDG